MKSQANDLIGTSFYNYLHPAELDQIKCDIESIKYNNNNFNGSIFRVRFVRLPYIRAKLGSSSPVPFHVSQMCADQSDTTYVVCSSLFSKLV